MVMIEARSHKNCEGKAELERVSHHITALGQLYSKLSIADTVEAVDAATYLYELCRDLIASVYKDGDAFIMLISLPMNGCGPPMAQVTSVPFVYGVRVNSTRFRHFIGRSMRGAMTTFLGTID
jgi:hypothetical protein